MFCGSSESNGRSTVAVLQTKTTIVLKPFTVAHNADGLNSLVKTLKTFGEDTKIVMEHTGRYYESIALSLHKEGFFVCTVNPLIIKDYSNGGNALRRVKTDNADAIKIAQFALDNWELLRKYIPVDTIRYQLKTLNRQYLLANKSRTACANNLIALLEMTYPGVRSHFTSPVREDGSQKWVDYAEAFWHLECIRELSEEAFVEQYREWCAKKKYYFKLDTAKFLYTDAKQRISLVPKDDTSKLIIVEAIKQLNAISRSVEVYRA